jgi:anthranilate phosphoribosyltransferase
METMIESALCVVEAGRDLDMDQASRAICAIMDGQVGDDQIARFLLALHRKGETVEEVAGAAAALRGRMTVIGSNRSGVIDTCGTGGDGSRTFNISTAAALVTAAAGVPVAKHGNRGVTSRSGSADVLAALGVNVGAGAACVAACLDELGIAFCFAPLLHQAMRHVAEVRRRLPVPTIFNILGPLANPARAPFQLLGVGRAPLAKLMAEALGRLGTARALVVHGSDGLDEVTLGGTTAVVEASPAGVREFAWQPADFGLPPVDRQRLLADDPGQSAEIIRRVLAGQPGPAREIVLANAAAALWTAGRLDRLPDCVALAAAALDSGAAADLLARLAERTRRG